ncbi:hypothetical protein ABZ016_10010 [Streptomyces sp. NPDC006372]|uniref:hypothetical protein n=1 Tax=Streptomyces sp. NPDC006372 TaxID=3155599 RepID=UPI0033B10E10
MRKKMMGVLGAVALAGVAFTSAPAVAAPAATASSGQVSTLAACQGEKIKARESVKIRKTKSVSGTALGLFPKGKAGCSLKNEKAKWYDDKCGQGSDQWDYISYNGTKGWVPTTCIVLA